jgi:hypothetical protein
MLMDLDINSWYAISQHCSDEGLDILGNYCREVLHRPANLGLDIQPKHPQTYCPRPSLLFIGQERHLKSHLNIRYDKFVFNLKKRLHVQLP